MQPVLFRDRKKVADGVFPEFSVPQIPVTGFQFLRDLFQDPDGGNPGCPVDGCGFLPLSSAEKLIVSEKLSGQSVAVIEKVRYFLHGTEISSGDPCVEHADRQITPADKILIDRHDVIRFKVFFRSVVDRYERFQENDHPQPLPQRSPAQEKGRGIHEFLAVFSCTGEHGDAALFSLFKMQIVHISVLFAFVPVNGSH